MLEDDNAELPDVVAEIPFVAEGASSDPPPTAPADAPAPAEEPAVLEAVAATVPVPEVVAWT